MTKKLDDRGDRGPYHERCRLQCLAWAEGRPQHNTVDDECCPDFSCCQSDLFTKMDEIRWNYYHKLYGRRQ